MRIRIPYSSRSSSPGGALLRDGYPSTLWKNMARILIVLLAIDTVVLAHEAGLVGLPWDLSDLEVARLGGIQTIRRYERELERFGFLPAEPARVFLSNMTDALAKAPTRGDVAATVIAAISGIQDLVTDGIRSSARNYAMEVISKDPGVRSLAPDGVTVMIRAASHGGDVDDPEGVLSPETRRKLEEAEVFSHLSEPLVLTLLPGGLVRVADVDLKKRVQYLKAEIERLRKQIADVRTAAGYTELSGPGVVVEAYDAPGGYTWEEIVHQKDILDVVNALFSAGAQGIEIGSERLVATSSVRCVGPVVLVNQRPVAVNPIVIKAVGPTKDLVKAVSPIREAFGRTGKRLEVYVRDSVTLSAYKVGKSGW